jgi:hypothetical protein
LFGAPVILSANSPQQVTLLDAAGGPHHQSRAGHRGIGFQIDREKGRCPMTHHVVDPTERGIDGADLATWLLFFLEAHGAEITPRPDRRLHVNLDPMVGLDAEIVGRWAPIITNLLPEFREILLARAACR